MDEYHYPKTLFSNLDSGAEIRFLLPSPPFHPVQVCAVMEWVIELGRGGGEAPRFLLFSVKSMR